MSDTYDTPNYVGELFFTTPKETPFLSMIGGLTGGLRTNSKTFAWQTVDNASAAQPAIVEGADTTFSQRSRSQAVNVVQIHQEGIQVSYTKQGATGNISGASILGNQPVTDEVGFQRQLKLQKIGRDIEYSFLQGAYTADTDISTARGTRGLASAISTNAVAASSATLGRSHLQSMFKAMADNGAPFNNVVLFANSFQRQIITDTYAYAPESRDVGGMSINQIEMDFGTVGVVYDRHMPTGSVFAVDLAMCAPVFLEIPGKGTLFAEPLAKSGAYEKWQLYCEVGLHYGPEQFHGKITGLATS
jgi:hypothetical protein